MPSSRSASPTGDDKAVAADLKKRNKEERKGQRTLGLSPPQIEAVRIELAEAGHALDAHGEGDTGAVAHKAEVFERLHGSDGWRRLKDACDLWSAAFFAKLQILAPGQPERIPTTDAVRRALAGQTPQALQVPLLELAALHFFHWPLEFPEVFDPTNPLAEQGFNVVVGNPPWERIKLQEQEFFAERDPEIANAPNKAARDRVIKKLEEAARQPLPDDPLERAERVRKAELWKEFQAAKHAADGASVFVRGSDRFPLTAVGDVNTYAIFAETFLCLINERGRTGIVVPMGIATDDSTKAFFGALASEQQLASLHAFENEEFVFRGLHHAYRFCLLTVSGSQRESSPDFVFFARQAPHLSDHRRHFTLNAEDIALINPNTRTCPIFRTGHDAELTKKIYRRVPVLNNESNGQAGNPWGMQFMAMFHMANDSSLFVPSHDLLDASHFQNEPDQTLISQILAIADERGLLPLYEAKLVHQFDHRWASYPGSTGSWRPWHAWRGLRSRQRT